MLLSVYSSIVCIYKIMTWNLRSWSNFIWIFFLEQMGLSKYETRDLSVEYEIGNLTL